MVALLPYQRFLQQAVRDGLLLKNDVSNASKMFGGAYTPFGFPVIQRNAEIAQILYSKFGHALPGVVYRAALFYSASPQHFHRLHPNIRNILQQTEGLIKARANREQYGKALSTLRDPNALVLNMAAALNGLRKVIEAPNDSTLKRSEILNEEAKNLANMVLRFHVPAAGLLGFHHFKTDLGESALQVLEPEEYMWLDANLEDIERSGSKHLADLMSYAREAAVQTGVRFTIATRPHRKQAFSAWEKIKRKRKERGTYNVSDLHDVLAFRVILHTADANKCYDFLSHFSRHPEVEEVDIHNNYLGNNKKPNGYEALHLKVSHGYDRSKQKPFLFDVQVKTEEMEQRANDAAAVHELHKGGQHESGGTKEGVFPLSVVKSLQKLGAHAGTKENNGRGSVSTLSVHFGDKVVPFSAPAGASVLHVVGALLSTKQMRRGFELSRRNPRGSWEPVHYSHKLGTGDVLQIDLGRHTYKPTSDWLKHTQHEHVRQVVRLGAAGVERQRKKG
ncbi:hypothetical protein HY571_00490 [Candidatus Micrarchaeota archaeon]|nr:hypothetical protein [Candidatus Micrarchaeota archaeon]